MEEIYPGGPFLGHRGTLGDAQESITPVSGDQMGY